MGLKERLNLAFELWELSLYDIPHELEVHPEILMNQLVSHPRNALPRDVGVAGSKIFRQVFNPLSDNFQVTNNGILGFWYRRRMRPYPRRCTLMPAPWHRAYVRDK